VNIPTKVLRVLWISEYRNALLRSRVFASTEHDHVLAGLDLNTVVDIGANRGQFALCIRHLYPRAQIFSFEPLKKPTLAWLRNFGTDTRAKLFNKAIALQSGSATMSVSRWDVSSSLLPFSQAQHDNFPLTEEASREVVETVVLDACIGEQDIRGCALLKLDVQGFELTALQGCSVLLERFQYVYVEASFIELYIGQALATEVLEFLLNRGFKLICVANLSYGKSARPIQADFLLVKAKDGAPSAARSAGPSGCRTT
jgi:FkbM family methyltransferase